MARSAFATDLKLIAFCWYTPWGATGAADGAGGEQGGRGEALGSRLSPIGHPPNFIFGNPGYPQSLKININILESRHDFGGQKTLFNQGDLGKVRLFPVLLQTLI
jgi:hypothetical protein